MTWTLTHTAHHPNTVFQTTVPSDSTPLCGKWHDQFCACSRKAHYSKNISYSFSHFPIPQHFLELDGIQRFGFLPRVHLFSALHWRVLLKHSGKERPLGQQRTKWLTHIPVPLDLFSSFKFPRKSLSSVFAKACICKWNIPQTIKPDTNLMTSIVFSRHALPSIHPFSLPKHT